MDEGDRFGDWTVVERIDSTSVLARCRCGVTKPVRVSNLRAGRSRRCRTCSVTRHGLTETKVHRAWGNLRRTTSLRPSFETFLLAVGMPPSDRHILVCTTPGQQSLEAYRWMTRAEAVQFRSPPKPRKPRKRNRKPLSEARHDSLRPID